MSVDFDKFVLWATNRFGEENVMIKGKEIRLNSFFTEDENFHLWCSPSGGKKKRKFGVYHCFKTDKKGSLLKLIQLVDHCDKHDAICKLNGRTGIRDLEQQLEEFLAKADTQQVVIPQPIKNVLELPPHCSLIEDLGTNNWWRKNCEVYLSNRKIPIDGLYICTDGRYKARIIIPYYDKTGRLIYWNGRHIGKSKSKYLGPDKEVGVGKEDVIFMAGKWPDIGETLYLCEGEFNAKSLKIAELNAAACGGKNMSEKQALMLSDYKVVICLDRDKAGKQGTTTMTSKLTNMPKNTSVGDREKLKYVLPPHGYNDWNEMLVAVGPVVLHHYILKNQKSLDYSWPHGTHLGYFNVLWNI